MPPALPDTEYDYSSEYARRRQRPGNGQGDDDQQVPQHRYNHRHQHELQLQTQNHAAHAVPPRGSLSSSSSEGSLRPGHRQSSQRGWAQGGLQHARNSGNRRPEDDALSQANRSWRSQLERGSRVDTLWAGRWVEAEVRELDPTRGEVNVVFLNDNLEEQCEWIYLSEVHCLNPARNSRPVGFAPGRELRVGQRVEVQDLYSLGWLPASVVDEEQDRVRIRFDGGGEFDSCEWLSRCEADSRVRPPERTMAPMSTKHRRLASLTALDASHRRAIDAAGERYNHYTVALRSHHLRIHPVEGDGNCLFRSVSHQIYGTDQWHGMVRQKCMDYMQSEARYFEPYVEGGMEEFYEYVQAKRQNGVWGDDPELQALCELYNCTAEVWAYDHREGAKRLRTLHESREGACQQMSAMRLSYYGGGHYDSIIPWGGFWSGLMPPSESPGTLEDLAISSSLRRQADAAQIMGLARTGRDGGEEKLEQDQDYAALQLVLRRSREEFDAQFEDLETALAASMENFDKAEEAEVRQVAADSELVALQEQMLLSAQAQSEEEQLEAVLRASAAESGVAHAGTASDMEHEMLLAALVESMSDSHCKEQTKPAPSMQPCPPNLDCSDPEELVTLQLQGGEDDEDLRRAILISLLDNQDN